MINRVILVGNVGKNPEIRSMGNGNEVASFSIATTESWKDKTSGERKEKTEWHSIVVFQKGIVNFVKNYVKKGSKLYIEGALQTRKWNDKSGIDHYKTEVILQGFNAVLQLLDSKGNSPEKQDSSVVSKKESVEKPEFNDEEDDDDIPFN